MGNQHHIDDAQRAAKGCGKLGGAGGNIPQDPSTKAFFDPPTYVMALRRVRGIRTGPLAS